MSLPMARHLRSRMTDAETKLWWYLRNNQLGNYKFRRQMPLGPYVLDFACESRKLVIEVDGGQHCENHYDQKRTIWLESKGWKVIRFWNNEVLQQTEAVLQTILKALSNPLQGERDT